MVWMKEGAFRGREPGGSPGSLSTGELRALFLDSGKDKLRRCKPELQFGLCGFKWGQSSWIT